MIATRQNRGTSVFLFFLMIAIMALMLLFATNYGSLRLTHHAKVAHAGERWDAADIRTAFQSGVCKPKIDLCPDNIEIHWCKYDGGELGLVVDPNAKDIITGFFSSMNGYWSQRCP